MTRMGAAAVVVCSDSVSAGRAEDRSGALAVELLAAAGLQVGPAAVVADEAESITAAIRAAQRQGADRIVTSGGTGLGPRDVTVPAVESLAAAAIPGVGEAIRAASRDRVPTADLSRSGCYLLDSTLVLCLPGSAGGVRDGLAVALPLLPHALAMISGGGHSHAHSESHSHGQGPALVSPAAIDVVALAAEAEAAAGGAGGVVVTFAGVVRNHDDGRSVLSLAYQAHPDAGAILADLLSQARARPGVLAAQARHRTGELEIGDVAYAVVVASAHRQEAFEACAWLVDEGKRLLPIWKLQRFADGNEEWLNCP